MSFTDFDIEDLKSTKKAVWALSCAILLISALDLEGNDINLLGLSIGISQHKIASILWLILILPFTRYTLSILYDTYLAGCRYVENQYQRRNDEELEEIKNIEGRGGYFSEPDDIMQGYERWHYDNSLQRMKRIQLLKRIAEWSQNLLNFILPRATIITIALFALFNPIALKQFLDHWETGPFIEHKVDQQESKDF